MQCFISAFELTVVLSGLPPLDCIINGMHAYTHNYAASRYEVPDQVLETIDSVAQSVAARASEVGMNYSSKKMIDIYSATGTFADW